MGLKYHFPTLPHQKGVGMSTRTCGKTDIDSGKSREKGVFTGANTFLPTIFTEIFGGSPTCLQ